MSFDRYDNLETKKLPDGRTVYKASRPITVNIDVTDLTFVANDADRLDVMGFTIYGDASQWWRIAKANGIVNGSLHIKPNTTISIPRP